MTTSLTETELDRLDAYFTSQDAMNVSMLDGYMAAVASGPNFVMPDQVLRWVWLAGTGDTPPESTIGISEQTISNLIIRHYQQVNDALNDQVYVPRMTDPQAWCRGYLAGFAVDMNAWAPLTAAQPELMKAIMAGDSSAALAEASRRIHAFWVLRRRQGMDLGGLPGQMASPSTSDSALPTQWPH